MNAIAPIVGSTVVMGLLDTVWLSFRGTYHEDLFQNVQGTRLTIRWIPALLVYVLMTVALYFGAIQGAKSVLDAGWKGAAIGFILYAFYDLTNYATLTNWTLYMTVTDALWGTLLCTIVAAIGAFITKATTV